MHDRAGDRLTPWHTHAHGLMQARQQSDEGNMHRLGKTMQLLCCMRAHMRLSILEANPPRKRTRSVHHLLIPAPPAWIR